MSNSSTAVSNVIQFKFEAREVRTLLVNDQPWFCASDVCEVLGYANSRQAIQKNCRSEGVSVRYTLTRGGKQALTFIAEGNLYRLIIKSRKEEAQRFEAWVCDEVLPAIRKHGRYEDSGNKMTTLVNDVIGVSGTNLINGVIGQKIAILPVGVQRQAKHKLHAILHTRFNVPRTELIPAEKLDVACDYLAAYALEGEWLGAAPLSAVSTLTDSDLLNINALVTHADWVQRIYRQYDLYNVFQALGSRAGVDLHDHVNGAAFVASSLKGKIGAELLRVKNEANEACARALARQSCMTA